ncbi:MAG: hypothetical protein ACRD5H_00100 [Nitrososphaerales archaeon]
MTDWLKFWPVILTFAVGLMGYAQLSADVENVKREYQEVRRLPVIEHQLGELKEKTSRIERYIEENSRDAAYFRGQQQELLDATRQNQDRLDQLLKKR